jgi:8-oxo-dGTP diphosphatase
MDKPIKIACDIFVLKGGKLLLGIRKGAYGAGDWGLPGGHLDWGEKLEDCAIRELKEETGIEVTSLKLVTVTDEARDIDHYIHFGFLLDNFAGEATLVEPDKCEKWEFFDLENLPENLFWPHKKLIENLKNQTLYSR